MRFKYMITYCITLKYHPFIAHIQRLISRLEALTVYLVHIDLLFDVHHTLTSARLLEVATSKNDSLLTLCAVNLVQIVFKNSHTFNLE